MGCCCGKPLAAFGGAKTIAVIGPRQSGVSTVARCFADSSNIPRRFDRTTEQWAQVPLPSCGAVDEWPTTRRFSVPARVVEIGGLALIRDKAKAMEALQRSTGVVVVLDSSRTLEEQDAAAVLRAVESTADDVESRPLVVLLNRFDMHLHTNTPAEVATRLKMTRRVGRWCILPFVATHKLITVDAIARFLLRTKRAPHIDLPTPQQLLAPADRVGLDDVQAGGPTQASAQKLPLAPAAKHSSADGCNYVAYDDVANQRPTAAAPSKARSGVQVGSVPPPPAARQPRMEAASSKGTASQPAVSKPGVGSPAASPATAAAGVGIAANVINRGYVKLPAGAKAS